MIIRNWGGKGVGTKALYFQNHVMKENEEDDSHENHGN